MSKTTIFEIDFPVLPGKLSLDEEQLTKFIDKNYNPIHRYASLTLQKIVYKFFEKNEEEFKKFIPKLYELEGTGYYLTSEHIDNFVIDYENSNSLSEFFKNNYLGKSRRSYYNQLIMERIVLEILQNKENKEYVSNLVKNYLEKDNILTSLYYENKYQKKFFDLMGYNEDRQYFTILIRQSEFDSKETLMWTERRRFNFISQGGPVFLAIREHVDSGNVGTSGTIELYHIGGKFVLDIIGDAGRVVTEIYKVDPDTYRPIKVKI